MERARMLDILLSVCFITVLFFSRVVEFSPNAGLEFAGKQLKGACLFQEWTKAPCPLCGLSRSFVSLAHGGIRESFSYNFLGPFIAFLFIPFVIATAMSTWRMSQPIIETHLFSRLILIIVVASLTLWVIRGIYYSQHPKQLELMVRK